VTEARVKGLTKDFIIDPKMINSNIRDNRAKGLFIPIGANRVTIKVKSKRKKIKVESMGLIVDKASRGTLRLRGRIFSLQDNMLTVERTETNSHNKFSKKDS
jgi:hypothetical protein